MMPGDESFESIGIQAGREAKTPPAGLYQPINYSNDPQLASVASRRNVFISNG